MTVADLSERELIARLRQQFAPPPPWLTIGIGDDAAVVEPERNHLDVLTVDACVEGVHFDRRFCPPDAIGHRALAVNLSDLAAMGAAPRLALLSMALPLTLSCDDFDQMIGGLAALARLERVHIVGGNLTRSPGPLMLDVTAVGSVKRRGILTRAGARPGDEVYVTGTLGAARAGLDELRGNTTARSDCASRYLYPQARVRVGVLLGRNRAASSCMDLSDGLADGVRQIAEASGVGIVLDAGAIPIEAGARAWFQAKGADALMEAVAGGDDYELLFTVSKRRRGRLRAAARHGGVALTRIGVCSDRREMRLQGTVDGRAMDAELPPGFRHFS